MKGNMKHVLERFSRRHSELQINHKVWNRWFKWFERLFSINYTYNSGFNKFLFKPLESGVQHMYYPGTFATYYGNGDIEYIETIISDRRSSMDTDPDPRYNKDIDLNKSRYDGYCNRSSDYELIEIYTDYSKDRDTTDEYICIDGLINSVNGRG
jgi:hypothetical protein